MLVRAPNRRFVLEPRHRSSVFGSLRITCVRGEGSGIDRSSPTRHPFLEAGLVDDVAADLGARVARRHRPRALAEFPFGENGYLLHLGRGTLRKVAGAGDTTNRYYDWAVDHAAVFEVTSRGWRGSER